MMSYHYVPNRKVIIFDQIFRNVISNRFIVFRNYWHKCSRFQCNMKEDVSTATELNILIQVKFHTNCMSNFIGFDVLLIVNKLEPR